MELIVPNNYILEGLKDFGFKYVKNEKKEVYQNQGIEVDVKTRKVNIVGKADPYIILSLYLHGLIDLKAL